MKIINMTKKILPIILIVSFVGSIYYSVDIAPNKITVKEYQVIDNDLPEQFNDFKIGFISDINLNVSNDTNKLKDIVEKINKQEYDIIFFGGDLYDTKIFDDIIVTEILKSIKVSYGKFSVLGEKDIINECSYILENGGFEVLNNNQRNIYYNGSSISLYGLITNANITGIELDNSFSIALIHQPDYIDELSTQSINLQLSGHSNGGYINLPLIGGILSKDGATNYISGVHTVNDTTLIISNGLGNEEGKSIRFNNACQIVSITLKSS